MQLSIRHATRYTYTEPLAYTIQQLHLTPRVEPQQHALHWKLAAPGHMSAYTDAYGNLSHMLTLDGQFGAVSIVAEGVVETSSPWQGRIAANDTLSPLIYTVSTRLTAQTPGILELAAACLPDGRAQTRHLLNLAEHIFGAVRYQSGATAVTTSASDALSLGEGVCQDHAHIFLACCHAHGIPARYVSGYIDPGDTNHAASHAWVDAWACDSSYEGWISIDVTHARLMTDAYCRIAIGRDYEGAAPIRGVRRGGGTEGLSVDVQIIPK
ncbi:transglutaminase-like putative cysteine protease [Pseudoduganella lurida]|uniref:Transglutaminase-like putative cysteine protease n=1 Tax=Pseudoduganella lurida TaxID=1036180 RepID=A0A562RJ26_9BURK|nr:transglutaminase family protein [Pseudoduganella lurida]TWI69079.1 transglutaminase-like putative cysteine protease [Pseudoduganella lurida]